MNPVGPAHLVRRGLRQAEVPDFAGPNQLGHGADGLFDRDLRVHTMQVVEIDLIDSKPF